MARERGLNGDVRNFTISDFTHQNNVGRLAQHGFKNGWKRETNLIAHLNLVDSLEVVFNGILGGDDFLVGPIKHVKGRVQSCGLAAARGTGDKKDSIGSANDFVERVQHVLLKTKI